MIGRSILSPNYLRAVGLLCSLAIAGAQQTQTAANTTTVPRLVHFAGTFHPPANSPGGPVGATFAIYAAQDGGAALWSEDQNVALDASGTYTVLLGATRNEGVPMELFAAGEPRWLEVKFHLPDEVALPRVLMVSVPYALKAADAETIGGLPPSAFALATVSTRAMAPAAAGSQPDATTPAVSGTGTTGFVPLWTNGSGALGDSVMFQSGTGTSAKIGINTSTPTSALDVKGAATVRGKLMLPASGTSTAKVTFDSMPLDLTASAFNSGTSSAQTENFSLLAEPVGNNTSNPSGSLNLLFGSGTNPPAETGLNIASNGQITFASGQVFPGAGTLTGVTAGSGLMGGGTTGSVTLGLTNTCASGQVLQWNGSAWACASGGSGGGSITGVTAGTDLTGGGTSGTVILNLDVTKVPQLNTANTFTGNQTTNGNLSATGVVTGSGYQIGSNLFASGSYANSNAFLGFAGTAASAGTGNTAVGASAMQTTTGSNNTATGSGALAFSGGSGSTASGYHALYYGGTGYSTATGYQALSLSNASFNTADGAEALQTNDAGTYNTATGFGALGGNTSGDGNTALGTGALGANTVGSYNTAVGYVAGSGTGINYESTGTYNTYLGYAAGPGSQTGFFNATAIGAGAVVNQNYSMALGGTGNWAVSVGIGTATPYFDYALDIEDTPIEGINGGVVVNSGGGNIYLGMTSGVHKFRVDTNGVTYADGGFQSSGADFAESFAVRGERAGYEPGDLLVIDARGGRRLALAQSPYSTMVAGIYSTKPGLLASPHTIDDARTHASEVPLAVVGTVPSKVTAENGAIKVGDLLVTSSRPGYAMKGTDRKRMLGAVVGKALEPLAAGTGVIEVLVTLQ